MNEQELNDKLAEREFELAAVNALLPELEFEDYGNGCPWQGEGKYLPIDGAHFYMRFRGNQASITVFEGEPFESEDLLSAVIWPFYEHDSKEAADGYAGWLDGVQEIVTLAKRLLEEVAPVSEDNPTSQQLLMQRVEELLAASKAARGE